MRSSSVLFVLGSATGAISASLETIDGIFGSNPTHLKFQIYVPEDLPGLPQQPSALIALHPCGMTGEEFYESNKLAEYADEHKFVLIYPTASREDGCWGVSDPNSMTHTSGGDSEGLVAMMNYAFYEHDVSQYGAFVMGVGSGASMANVLMATYPDVFGAGVAVSGAPHGCYYGAEGTNTTCSDGELTHTPAEWGDFVNNSFPNFGFARPRVQIWAGAGDTEVNPNNFYETLKQWSDVLSLELTQNETGVPTDDFTKFFYGTGLEGYFAEDLEGPVPVMEETILSFLGVM